MASGPGAARWTSACTSALAGPVHHIRPVVAAIRRPSIIHQKVDIIIKRLLFLSPKGRRYHQEVGGR